MSICLFAAEESARGFASFLGENGLLLLPPVLGFVAIYLLLPKARRLTPLWGGIVAALALILGAYLFIRIETVWEETVLFYAFSGLAILGGGMMITQQNPVHAALCFALVVLSSCGLFLLQAAPFLMAATIIIYAGAIVVTFLFVIMLAQQEGFSTADQRSREPFLASLAGCVLMASVLCVLHKTYHTADLDALTRDLQRISVIHDERDAKALLGDPTKAEEGKRTLPVVKDLRAQLANHRDEELDNEIQRLQMNWLHLKIDPLKENARVLLAKAQERRGQQGSLAVGEVRGKTNTPGHFKPGHLPAANVAAIGRTLFTDYLVPVELAATLLLVATIGAIIIAARRSEELR